MATDFPATGLDTFTNPGATDKVSAEVGGRTHSEFHADINDAVEALEAKVGVDSSAVTTSHDYKLSEITTTDKAVGKTAIQTLTNKTLTSPKVGTAIADTNGNEVIKTPATGSAVNEITVTNSATGNDPQISATGEDTDISLKIRPKGAGKIKVGLADLQLPNVDGSANQVLKTDGSGVLGWVSQSGSPLAKTYIPMSNRNMINCGSATSIVKVDHEDAATVMRVGQIFIPFEIVVNHITFQGAADTGDGTFKLAIFSEDGQTRYINESCDITSADVNVTHDLSSPVTLSPGVYYIAIVPTATGVQIQYLAWLTNIGDGTTYFNAPTGLPVMEGKLTVTSGTIPSTIDPLNITGAINSTMAVRLDN